MPRRTAQANIEYLIPTLPDPLPTPSLDSTSLRMSYRIARGEQGVLTFEPYKSTLLPFWRFKTVGIAQDSSRTLKHAFDAYVRLGDFVGADMARKFVQMGMTRAKRYANHKGGRKYAKGEQVGVDGKRVELKKSEGHDGKEEKEQASLIFKALWRECVEDEGYLRLKKEFMAEQKAWDRDVKKRTKTEVKDEVEDKIKLEDAEDG